MANRVCKNKFVRFDAVEKAREEIGNTYGYLRVVGVSHVRDKQLNILHEVTCTLCNSGEVFLARIAFLRNGRTKSCGCLRTKLMQDRMIARNKERARKTQRWFEVYKGWWIDARFCATLEANTGRTYWDKLDKLIATGLHPLRDDATPMPEGMLFSELKGTLVSTLASVNEGKLVLACQTEKHQVLFEVDKNQHTPTLLDVGHEFKFSWSNGSLVMEALPDEPQP